MEGLEVKKQEDTPLGTDPASSLPVLLLSGKFGPYIQLGKTEKGKEKPRRASLPRGTDPTKVTFVDALKYLSLPRLLGKDSTGKEITASRGRFGPYVVREGDFRSLKAPDDVYTVTLARALEIFSEPKKFGKFRKKKVEKI